MIGLDFDPRSELKIKHPFFIKFLTFEAAFEAVYAAVAELVDAHVSEACIRKDVGVRLPPAALGPGLQSRALFYCFTHEPKPGFYTLKPRMTADFIQEATCSFPSISK